MDYPLHHIELRRPAVYSDHRDPRQDDCPKPIDAAPIQLVQDTNQQDFIVRNGISCIGCHSSGIITAQDDLRWELDQGDGAIFDDPRRDQIRRIYPERSEFAALLAEDSQRFTDALNILAIPTTQKEPILATFQGFNEDIRLRRAAAELGLSESDLRMWIGGLSPDLNDLARGGSVQRADFTANFAASICALNLGHTKACPL